MAFVTPVVKHWLELQIAQWGIDSMIHHMTPLLLPQSYTKPHPGSDPDMTGSDPDMTLPSCRDV